jgi:hypothetical protein
VDAVINFGYFLVGLFIGLLQLWQSQKYFQAQQQDKFDHISRELTMLRERTAELAAIVSDQASSREHEYFKLISAAHSMVATAADEASTDIRGAILEELQRAGVQDAIQRTIDLDERVSDIVTRLTEQLSQSDAFYRAVSHEVSPQLIDRTLKAAQSFQGKPFNIFQLIEAIDFDDPRISTSNMRERHRVVFPVVLSLLRLRLLSQVGETTFQVPDSISQPTQTPLKG